MVDVAGNGRRVFVEIGPRQTLSVLVVCAASYVTFRRDDSGVCILLR